jgi:hypothetical protein
MGASCGIDRKSKAENHQVPTASWFVLHCHFEKKLILYTLYRCCSDNLGSTEPMYTVPTWANPCFIGRGETLCRLEELLRADGNRQPRAAMYGLGGIGYVPTPSGESVYSVSGSIFNSA